MSDYFFYTGNAYPHKNLGRLIEAIKLLNDGAEYPVILKIASSKNVFTKRLEKTVKELSAEKYVELLGFVADERMENLYKNAVAFVFPTLAEGFGLPGVEAMKAGTLVLASNIPVLKEIYESHAIYFNPLNITSIEKAMENALEMSESERVGKIKSAQEFVKRYSWDKMAQETLKIYYEESGNSLRSGK